MIRTIAHLLIDPFLHFALVLLLGFVLSLTRRQRLATYVFFYAGLWFFVTAVSPVPWWLVTDLESAYSSYQPSPVDTSSAGETHIVVLGGGSTYSPFLPPNDQLSHTTVGRLVEGARIHRLIPGSKVVCSGASGNKIESQAILTARTSMFLGIAPADTIMIESPQSTEEEARDYAQRFGGQHPVILVTDATHMTRAVFWFRRYGIDAHAAPTNHCIKPDPGRYDFPFRPSYRKMAMLDKVLHEYAGLLYAYWKTGKWGC